MAFNNMSLIPILVIFIQSLSIYCSIYVYMYIIKHVQSGQVRSRRGIISIIRICISMMKYCISKTILAKHVKSLNQLNLNIVVPVECVWLDSTTTVSGFVNVLVYITTNTSSLSLPVM